MRQISEFVLINDGGDILTHVMRETINVFISPIEAIQVYFIFELHEKL